MKNKAFTLIELLVVIVIIGILATISTATFGEYQKKARDTEREVFIQNVKKILIASQLESDAADYDLGGADAAGTETALINLLDNQGYKVPSSKSGIEYFYAINGTPNGSTSTVAADSYALWACKFSCTFN